MPTAKRLTLESVSLDDEREMDAEGHVLLKELPPNMRENSERDFGG